MNRAISTSPNSPRASKETAHGIRKIISMSKTMKSMAVK
jgi:hypothetical protein